MIGPFSDEVIVVIPDDTTPPAAPSTPSVTTRLGMIHVGWDGLSADGTAMPSDLDHVRVWLADPDEPGSAAVVDAMSVAETVVIGGQPYGEGRLVWLTAVDRSGNESPPSGSVSVTTQPLVDTDLIGKIIQGANIKTGTVNAADAVIANTITGNLVQANAISAGHLQTNAVTADKIAAGSITAGKLQSVLTLSSRIVAGNPSSARVELNSGGIGMWNSAGVQTVMMAASTGSFSFRTGQSGARVQLDANGLTAYNSSNQQTVNISSATGTATLIGQLSSGPSGRRIVVSPDGATDPEIRFYDDNGSSYCRIVVPPRGERTTLQLHSSNGWLSKSRLDISETAFLLWHTDDGGAETYVSGTQNHIDLVTPHGPRLLLNWDGKSIIWGDEIHLSSLGTIYLFGNPVRVEGSLWVNGNSKTFIIDHPLRDDSYLVHATTESPHNGVEYWGEVVLDEHGQAIVELPGYFEALTAKEGRAVIVTPLTGGGLITVSRPTEGRFTLDGPPGAEAFWLVKAIRSDVPPLMVEPRRDQIRVHGDGPYRYYTIKESHG